MPGFAGFDAETYPGDATMAYLQNNTNLVWCGYYLAPSPSQQGTSWMGNRAALNAAGWGILPIYVGEQVIGPGSQHPSAAKGQSDGAQAAQYMDSEGFPAGSYVYLDLENGRPFPPLLQDYVTSWCAAVAATAYLPGVYCSHSFAIDVHNLAPAARIWAFYVQTTAPHPVLNPFPDPDPSGCGYIGATAWQLGQSCRIRTQAAQPLEVDLSTANLADPGAPDPPQV
jgi:hypothetical protein